MTNFIGNLAFDGFADVTGANTRGAGFDALDAPVLPGANFLKIRREFTSFFTRTFDSDTTTSLGKTTVGAAETKGNALLADFTFSCHDCLKLSTVFRGAKNVAQLKRLFIRFYAILSSYLRADAFENDAFYSCKASMQDLIQDDFTCLPTIWYLKGLH